MPAKINRAGQRYGRLLVVKAGPSAYNPDGTPRLQWWCECECGLACVLIRATHLASGRSASCGCLQRERASAAKTKHGESRSSVYALWCRIKTRCYNANSQDYPDYGAAGVIVHAPWINDYPVFRDWILSNLGPQPDGMTLDRHPDQYGNYEPGNLRWATPLQQANNKTNNVKVTFNGVTRTASEWSRITGIDYDALYTRLCKLGWPPEKALTTPIQKQVNPSPQPTYPLQPRA